MTKEDFEQNLQIGDEVMITHGIHKGRHCIVDKKERNNRVWIDFDGVIIPTSYRFLTLLKTLKKDDEIDEVFEKIKEMGDGDYRIVDLITDMRSKRATINEFNSLFKLIKNVRKDNT